MRHGLYLPTHGPFADARALADLAAAAENAGWDGVFIWDELLPIFDEWQDTGDSFVALTAMAAATERIRLGALVSPLPRLRPESFAKLTATLDRLSNGRLIVGVGLGNPPSQYSMFGLEADIKIRAAMLDEHLEVVARLWTGEPVTFRGDHYLVEDVTLRPTPIQSPRIPIWAGADAGTKPPRRRAKRWDGLAPASTSWPDGVISVDECREMAADIGAGRDLVLIGSRDATKPALDELDAYAAAGVTWILTQAFTLDDARERIRRGPPS